MRDDNNIIKVKPRRISLRDGDNARFQCRVNLKEGTYTIKWKFNNFELPINAVLSRNKKKIKLSEIQSHNSGLYTCEVYSNNGYKYSDTASLKVTGKLLVFKYFLPKWIHLA